MKMKDMLEQRKIMETVLHNTKIELDIINRKIRKECKHPPTLIKHTEDYNSGGYDYTAYTEHKWTCECCGLVIKKKTVEHDGQ